MASSCKSYLHHCNSHLLLDGGLHCMYMSNYISHSPAVKAYGRIVQCQIS